MCAHILTRHIRHGLSFCCKEDHGTGKVSVNPNYLAGPVFGPPGSLLSGIHAPCISQDPSQLKKIESPSSHWSLRIVILCLFRPVTRHASPVSCQLDAQLVKTAVCKRPLKYHTGQTCVCKEGIAQVKREKKKVQNN